jgi:polyether ionophore transport system permease protein
VTASAGAEQLVRASGRRDRVRIGVWIATIAGLVAAVTSSVKALYPTQPDLDSAAKAAEDSAVALAFKGPSQGLDTIGGQVAFQIVAFGIVAVALMSLLTVVRLTRAEEETGRLELVRALPIGRRAPLTSAMVVVAGMDVAVGVLVALALLAYGLPTSGSVMIGTSFALVGLLFGAIAAVTAQVTENARVAAGLAGAALAVSFVLRAIGDVGDGRLSWLSPIGWAQKARPYAGERWWPLLLPVVGAAVLVAVAVRLLDRRDLGAGLIPARPGPATAAPSLSTVSGLARRLQRGGLLWWGLAVLLLGVGYGSITGNIDDFVNGNQTIEDVIARGPGSLVDSFLATSLLILALVTAAFAVQSVGRLRTEESGGRTEVLLATPTARLQWAASHLAIAFCGSALVLLVGGAGLGLVAGLTSSDLGQLGRVTLASLAYIPPVWILAAIAVVLFGVVPQWTALAWAPVGACLVIGMFGTLLDLPSVVVDLSPFELTPSVPAAAWDGIPIVVLTAIGAAVTAIGLTAFRRRDLTT